MPQNISAVKENPLSWSDVLESAKQILIDKKFALSGAPVADGKIHRVQVGNEKANLVGWYVLYPDEPPFLTGGNWQTGEEFKEALGGGYSQQTPADKALMDQRIAEAKRQRDEEKVRIHDQAAIESNAEYDAAEPATDNHDYLVKKKAKAYGGIKIRRGYLVVPVMNERGEIRSLQTIAADGEKRFKTGGEIRGNYFTIPGDSRHIVISEGYATGATIHELAGWTVVIAFNAGNLPSVAKKIRMQYPASEILIGADNDQWTDGNPGVSKATEAGAAINARVVIPHFKDKSSKPTDFNDLFRLEGADAVIRQVAEPEEIRQKYVAIGIGDFLQHTFPPRKNILEPWLPRQGLVMVYAYRGVGKTHFALGVGYASCSRGSFLGWSAPEPVGVLYIDGEMPGVVMQERLAELVANSPTEPMAPFVIMTPDLQPEGMPRIDTEEGQSAIEQFITDEIKLIIVDNISTLSGAKENGADDWTPVQAWALRQRAQKRSVLFIHHSGKTGAQRGTSRREDVLDTVIALKRPADYHPELGAVFEIHFEKARGLYGDAVKPIEATLTTDEHGRTAWATRTVEDSTFDRVVELLNEGLSQNDIATELNIHKSNVSRHASKAAAAGLIQVKPRKKRSPKNE